MTINEAIQELDKIFFKYGIKDEKDILGYRNNLMEYIKSLEGVKLEDEYKKHEFLYEFIDLQKKVGLDKDLLNNYTMLLTSSNRKLGQDFTPDGLLQLVSELVDDNKSQYPLFYDCAGGTGSQVIKGYYKWLDNKKFLDQYKAILEVDEYDTYNCYCCVFNFIIRGLNAIVRNKDTLTGQTFAVFIMTNEITHNGNMRWYSDYKTILGDEMYEY